MIQMQKGQFGISELPFCFGHEVEAKRLQSANCPFSGLSTVFKVYQLKDN